MIESAVAMLEGFVQARSQQIALIEVDAPDAWLGRSFELRSRATGAVARVLISQHSLDLHVGRGVAVEFPSGDPMTVKSSTSALLDLLTVVVDRGFAEVVTPNAGGQVVKSRALVIGDQPITTAIAHNFTWRREQQTIEHGGWAAASPGAAV